MSYKLILPYVNSAIQIINNKLVFPVQYLHNKLSLGTDSLPDVLKTPINFATIFSFFIFIMVTFANNLICNLIGILYPLMYGLNIFNEKSIDTNRLISHNKYWILYGVITLFDSFFGFFLHFVPGYFYLKLILTYLLVRNDFMFTSISFSTFSVLYEKYDIRKKIEKSLALVNIKFDPKTNLKKSSPNKTLEFNTPTILEELVIVPISASVHPLQDNPLQDNVE